MTEDQAQEILRYLIFELNYYGYGGVVSQVNTLLEEDYRNGNSNSELKIKDLRSQLNMFLKFAVIVFDSISSRSVSGTILRLNNNLVNKVTSVEIYIDLINDTEVNLSSLPDYTPIVEMLNDLIRTLQDE